MIKFLRAMPQHKACVISQAIIIVRVRLTFYIHVSARLYTNGTKKLWDFSIAADIQEW